MIPCVSPALGPGERGLRPARANRALSGTWWPMALRHDGIQLALKADGLNVPEGSRPDTVMARWTVPAGI